MDEARPKESRKLPAEGMDGRDSLSSPMDFTEDCELCIGLYFLSTYALSIEIWRAVRYSLRSLASLLLEWLAFRGLDPGRRKLKSHPIRDLRDASWSSS